MGGYAKIVVRFPYVFIAVDLILAVVLGPVTVWMYGVPDLSQPTKGFEARGTQITGWMYTAQFIADQLGDGNLTMTPGATMNMRTAGDPNVIGSPKEAPLQNLDEPLDPLRTPRLVITGVEHGADLLSPNILRAICDLQQTFLDTQCENTCQTLSLSNLIADYVHKPCQHIDDDDVAGVRSLLQECAQFYYSGDLKDVCGVSAPGSCGDVPRRCSDRNTVYQILDQFVDGGFQDKFTATYSMIYLRWNSTLSDLGYFYIKHLHREHIANAQVKVQGMNLMLVDELFRWFVTQDITWYVIAMAFVILILVAYLRSLTLMLTAILNVIFAISLAYWFYFMICRFTYFPYVNIAAILLLIAIGADDLFIFYDIWRDEKRKTPEITHEALVTSVLHQGGISVFVTSFTTAAALLANLVSDVTAIRCFGVFSAICVLMNFVLFITWVPAILLIVDRSKCCKTLRCCDSCIPCDGVPSNRCKAVRVWGERCWSITLPKIVTKGAPYWTTLFTSLSVLSLVGVFWKPGLNLPSSTEIRALVPSHPFEEYNWKTKQHFRFEQRAPMRLSAKYIWGAHGKDNGDWLNANDFGHLSFDENFRLTTESQLWLAEFCQNLLSRDFIDANFVQNITCYWTAFSSFVEEECDNTGNRTCCGLHFPVNVSYIDICMQEFSYIQDDYHNVTNYTQLVGRPIFDMNGSVKLFQLKFLTKYTWDSDFENMDNIYKTLSDYSSSELKTAPEGLDSGWFVGAHLYEFEFYNVQLALSRGTFSGLGLYLGVGFVVLLLTTLNIVLTLYAVITITFVLASTAGVLVLLGWELGFSEALTLTLSMGLSIDVTIHLGMAYKMAPADSRPMRVQHVLKTVGPAVTMAIVTTFTAGAVLMLAQLWAYRQIGTFLVVSMVFSWLYGILFFLPVCVLLGPTGYIGNLKAFCEKKTRSTNAKRNNLQVQTSSICNLYPSSTRGIPSGTTIVKSNKDKPVMMGNILSANNETAIDYSDSLSGHISQRHLTNNVVNRLQERRLVSGNNVDVYFTTISSQTTRQPAAGVHTNTTLIKTNNIFNDNNLKDDLLY